MYDTFLREYYWRHMFAHVYNTVRNFQDYPRIGTKFKYQRQLQLFSQTSQIESIAIDILRRLPRTKSASQYVVIVSD